MKKWFVITACVTLLGNSLVGNSPALAQDSSRNLPPKALRQPTAQPGNAGTLPAAPVGHRQPTPGSLPPNAESGKNDPDRIDAQDRELDRMIKNICKGC